MSASPLPPSVIADARAAAKAFLRLDGAGEDALIDRLVASAIQLGEAFLAGLLIARACEDVIAADGCWRKLAGEPVSAIAGVAALPPGGAAVALPVDAYAVEIGADGRGWVRVKGARGLARVDYSAGLAPDWAGVPEPIAQGVVLLAAHLFDHRDANALPPVAVSALWRPFRRARLREQQP